MLNINRRFREEFKMRKIQMRKEGNKFKKNQKRKRKRGNCLKMKMNRNRNIMRWNSIKEKCNLKFQTKIIMQLQSKN